MLKRCDEDDPNRCQASNANLQCPFLAEPGSKYCGRHSGSTVQVIQEQQRARQYRLQVWQQRLDEFTESPDVKSIRDEIGILRLVLENVLNKASDDHALLMYSAQISDLCVKIEKLVSSCNRLEVNMGMLLDKSAALNLAGQIVEIIGRHVAEPEVIDSISNDIISALATLK